MSNYDEERAERAEMALCAMSEACQSLEPISIAGDRTFITDLLADLRHFCAREEITFSELVEMSEMHFEAEAEEENE